MGMQHTFRSEELYELVWSTPMSKLARRLGVSDVGLAKACKRADIPGPGLGYWAKLQHGKKVMRTPLPPPTPKTPAVVQISPGPSNLLNSLAPEVQEKIARESSEEWHIAVPKTQSNLHPLLRPWLEENRNGDGSWPRHVHSQRTSARDAKVERRRLRILNGVFRALEKRGHQIVADPQTLAILIW